MIEDPYRVLEVDGDASAEQIRRSFRRLARSLHPDLNPENPEAAERFVVVSEAYRVLLDPRERAEADRDSGRVTAVAPDPDGAPSIFQESARRWARDGQDVVAVAKIDLVTSIGGGSVDVQVTGPVTCTACDGSGYDPDGNVVTCWTCDGLGQVTFTNRMGESTGVCLTCGGEGRQATQPCTTCDERGTVTGDRVVAVMLPLGVDDGDTVVVPRAGGPGGRAGRPGDLLVFVTIDPHPVFSRQGLDLCITVPVTFPEAALGSTITIPTFGDPVSVRIPAGTQGGTVMSVTGRGITSEAGDTGDLLITINIAVPTDLTEEEQSTLEKLTNPVGSELRSVLFDEMDR